VSWHAQPDRQRSRNGGARLTAGGTLTLGASCAALNRKITTWREEQARERVLMASSWTNAPYLFTNKHGGSIEPRWFSKHFGELVAQSGVTRITPHGMRHSYATNLLEGGTNQRHVQESLGHATLSMTTDLYGGHKIKGSEVWVAQAMEKMLVE
jgi:site-specific recombinase XerD